MLARPDLPLAGLAAAVVGSATTGAGSVVGSVVGSAVGAGLGSIGMSSSWMFHQPSITSIGLLTRPSPY